MSLLTVVLLLICTCAYLRSFMPSLLDRNKEGLLGIFWKCARIDLTDEWRKQNDFRPLIRPKDNTLNIYCDFNDVIPPCERKSPYVAVCCVAMALSILFL